MQLLDIQGGTLHVVSVVHTSPGGFDNTVLTMEIFDLKNVEHSYHYWIFKLKQILLTIEIAEDGRIEGLDVENLEEHGGVVAPHFIDPPEGICSDWVSHYGTTIAVALAGPEYINELQTPEISQLIRLLSEI